MAFALFATPASASIDPVADFFDNIFQPQQTETVTWRKHGRHYRSIPDASGGVSAMISEHVSARIGSEWVPTALQIARIESGGRCGARNRSGATGVFQVINPERFGVSRSAALTCSGGIQAGVSHMAACIAKGAHTHSQMMRCHNSGSPFGRVERAYQRYV
ncbi:MAG: hypothetical protein EB015_21165 [Methylocystaceae bacterium]|nr:hypothetical protein [Methylocystaceae bacterium]